MFDFFTNISTYMSGIYDAITMPFKWSGYLFDAITSILYLPTQLQAYIPSVVVPAVFIVVSIGIIRTVLSLLPF